MFKNKKAIFYKNINELYSNNQLELSEELRTQLLKTINDFHQGDRISYLAYRLYPYVLKESFSNQSNEFILFKKYIEKVRWKYYFGEVLGMAFKK